MVCETCQRVLLREAPCQGHTMDDESDWIQYIHHTDFRSLWAAVESGCQLCSEFWNRLDTDEQAELEKSDGVVGDANRSRFDHLTVAELCFCVDMVKIVILRPGPGSWPNRDVFARKFDSFSLLPQGFPVQGASERACEGPDAAYRAISFGKGRMSTVMTLIESWTHRCESDHTQCNGDHDRKGWNPTRLLDVGQAHRGTIKLINTSEVMGELVYTTLSHRWGDGHLLKLNKMTELSLRSGIDLGSLPQTFQDAIILTHAMGKPYIWIDCLCIIQDEADLADWKVESSLMHRVYGYAFCNIAATAARNSSEGLFRRLQAGPAEVVHVAMDQSNPDSTRDRPHWLIPRFFWANGVSAAPLNKRGWVLQERLLAKRVIHFAERQIFWECCELDAAEVCPQGLPSEMIQWYSTGFKNLHSQGKIPRVDGTESHDYWANKLWCRIVSVYSQCQLTNPQDKLIAIAGIAHRMSHVLHDEYIAGMWRKTLHSDLLWHTSPGTPHSRPNEYRAPTWSWASIDGRVSIALILEDGLLFSVKDVSLSYVTTDTTGLLAGAELIIECRVRRMMISFSGSFATSRSATLVVNERRIETRGQFYHQISRPDMLFDVDPRVVGPEAENQLVYYTEGCVWQGKPSPYETLCIMVLRCEDEAAGTFSRVGICTHLREAGQQCDDWDAFRAEDEDASSIPCVSWDAEKKLHTIRVI